MEFEEFDDFDSSSRHYEILNSSNSFSQWFGILEVANSSFLIVGSFTIDQSFEMSKANEVKLKVSETTLLFGTLDFIVGGERLKNIEDSGLGFGLLSIYKEGIWVHLIKVEASQFYYSTGLGTLNRPEKL